MPVERPHVLLITLDTTRADALGCYEAGSTATPNLDRFATTGHLFERCETVVPQTLPAHATIMTGLNPYRHGVRRNFEDVVGPELPLLADDFRADGYATGAFVSAFVVAGRSGLVRGFDHYDEPAYSHDRGFESEGRARATVDRALEWIGSSTGPWFVWVHLFDPHTPYEPPATFSDRFPNEPYLGEVAAMDHEIGRLLDALEVGGLSSSTLVVIAGDHGEGLGDHGEPTHGILLYESTTRVPLLIRLPGQTAGVRHTATVGLVDLAPTLLGVIDVERATDGVSLMPVLADPSRSLPDRTLYMEALEGTFRSGWAPLFAAVQGPWKYIQSPNPELYDLVSDPSETTDVSATNGRLVTQLDGYLDGLNPLDLDPADSAPELTDQERAALHSLGYLTGREGQAAGSRVNPRDVIHLAEIHQRAVSALQSNDFVLAARLFEQELAEDPDSALVMWYLASSLMTTDPQRSADLLKQAIRQRPSFEEPYVTLCQLMEQHRQPGNMVPVAEDGIGKTKDAFGRLHYYRALGVLSNQGDTAAVMRDLEVAIERSPSPARSYRLRAAVHLHRRDDRRAALDDLGQFAATAAPSDLDRLGGDPVFRSLHDDARFAALVNPARGESR
jgi:arylsulfatase A-like enzyme